MRGWWVGAVLVAALAAGCSSEKGASGRPPVAGPDAAPARLPTVTFTTAAGMPVPLAVEVADDDAERTCGLMHRTELPAEQGMVFLFAQDAQGGFWMRNTLIPLSIAYVSADGRVVDILEMKPVPAPGNTPYRLPDGREVPVGDGQAAPPGAQWVTYPPRGAYRYAIEANQGWFARHGIAVGDRVVMTAAEQDPNAAAPPPICRDRGI